MNRTEVVKGLVKIAKKITAAGAVLPYVSIAWEEPEEDSCKIFVDGLTIAEINDVIKWLKKEGGSDYGSTIPSVEVLGEKPVKKGREVWDIDTFAAAIRYDDGVYETDCPVFKKHNVARH